MDQAEKKELPPSKATVAFCVLLGAAGLFMCVQAVRGAMRSLAEDAAIAGDMDDEPTPRELEAARLLEENEELDARIEKLKSEQRELDERVAALTSRAPAMPEILTWVALADGTQVYLAAGSEDKVERGFQFSITRKKAFVARVVVQVVSERACACRVLVVKEGEKIQVGDEALTALR